MSYAYVYPAARHLAMPQMPQTIQWQQHYVTQVNPSLRAYSGPIHHPVQLLPGHTYSNHSQLALESLRSPSLTPSNVSLQASSSSATPKMSLGSTSTCCPSDAGEDNLWAQAQIKELRAALEQERSARERQEKALAEERKSLSDKLLTTEQMLQAAQEAVQKKDFELAKLRLQYNEIAKDWLETFTDSISGELLVNPHCGPDGFTYSLNSAMCWLGQSERSPHTRAPMTQSMLVHSILAEKGLEVIRKHYSALVNEKLKQQPAAQGAQDFANDMGMAIIAGDLDRAMQLLSCADKEQVNRTCISPKGEKGNILHLALVRRQPQIARAIIENAKFWALDLVTSEGFTALHQAVAENYVDVCQALIRKAGPSAAAIGVKKTCCLRDHLNRRIVLDSGTTPLDLARRLQLQELIRVLGGHATCPVAQSWASRAPLAHSAATSSTPRAGGPYFYAAPPQITRSSGRVIHGGAQATVMSHPPPAYWSQPLQTTGGVVRGCGPPQVVLPR